MWFVCVLLCVCLCVGACSEIVAWSKCRLIDVKSGGKKDTCKLALEVKDALPECRFLGAVVAKAKGKKK
jgi:hypothetical protein